MSILLCDKTRLRRIIRRMKNIISAWAPKHIEDNSARDSIRNILNQTFSLLETHKYITHGIDKRSYEAICGEVKDLNRYHHVQPDVSIFIGIVNNIYKIARGIASNFPELRGTNLESLSHEQFLEICGNKNPQDKHTGDVTKTRIREFLHKFWKFITTLSTISRIVCILVAIGVIPAVGLRFGWRPEYPSASDYITLTSISPNNGLSGETPIFAELEVDLHLGWGRQRVLYILYKRENWQDTEIGRDELFPILFWGTRQVYLTTHEFDRRYTYRMRVYINGIPLGDRLLHGELR